MKTYRRIFHPAHRYVQLRYNLWFLKRDKILSALLFELL